jgi:hypothetical protein
MKRPSVPEALSRRGSRRKDFGADWRVGSLKEMGSGWEEQPESRSIMDPTDLVYRTPVLSGSDLESPEKTEWTWIVFGKRSKML